jgi:cobalt-zinc-cadmium resistance protein CzcA
MIARLVEQSFAKSGLTLLLAVAASGLGAYAFLSLRRDVFPDLSAPIFNVIVQNATMGAEELETGIAIPMEAALAGLPDVRRIRSVSQLGVSQVTVEFESDADYYRSRQFVSERVAQASTELPAGTDAPLVSSLTGRLNEIFEFTLEAEPGSSDLMTLRDLAEFDVKNRLLAVPGVAAVERLGGYLRQFQIQLDPDRMSARRVSLADVLHAVEGSNVNASGGFIVQGATEWAVRAVGRARNVNDLGQTVVVVRDAVPVFLSDVADIREAPAIRRGVAHRLRGEVVSARIVKQFGADTVTVAAGIRHAVEEIRKSLPEGVTLRIVYDQSALVADALGGVGRAVLIGAAFVVVVLFLLLGNLRAALVVTLTIPLSIALSGLLLKQAGVGINTMTLGGLAIAVGLLVDAAIIVTENILHRLEQQGTAGAGLAQRAAIEVGRPITFATLIIIAVFLPLFGMSGIEGRMYQPLAAAVIAAMASALLLALTAVPVMAGWLLRHHMATEDPWILRKLKSAYAPMLDASLKHPIAVALTAMMCAAAALGGSLLVGTDFMPELDEGALLLQTVLPQDASLDEVDRLNHRIEDVLREFPEVEDVVRRTGRAERTEDPMPHTMSDVLVVLKRQRARSVAELEDAMRERVATVPGVTTLFTTPLGMRIDEGLGGTPADVSVRIFGPDLDVLAGLAQKAQALMQGVHGIADLRTEQSTGLPQLEITVDRAATARVGLSPGDVIDAVRIGLVGHESSQVWVGQRRFDLVVRLQDDRRRDLHNIRSLLIDGHDGTRIPLGQLANIAEVFGPGAIRRESGMRRVAVEASVAGRDLGSTASEVRAALDTGLTLPGSYFVDVGGRVESQARASKALTTAIVTAVLAVFVLLYLALGSAAEAALILVTVPIAFVGGIAALLISGQTWNVSSLVGLIGLFGIAVQNSLVLVTQTRGLVEGGTPFREALREASLGRLRPKVMTAATAILGLMPFIVLRLHGTEIERPLAVVMVGGLVTSTIFTLIALPAAYAQLDSWRERMGSRRRSAGTGP